MMEKTTGVRVLFTGEYWPGSNTIYIARAFEQCGAVVRFLDLTSFLPTGWEQTLGRLSRRLLLPIIEMEWNRKVLSLVDRFEPDLIYFTNAHICNPKTLQAIRARNIPVMCFYHDPEWIKRPQSRFSQNLPFFDLVASTRSWHKTEFQAAGAREVMIVRFGYEPEIHHPIDLSRISQACLQHYQADITFIGSSHPYRATALSDLVTSEFAYKFKIWGSSSWRRLPNSHPVKTYWQKRDVLEQEIPIIYTASKVALHWVHWEPDNDNVALRKGDQHNSRTFQIAACGGAMMLAQRTEEHLALFTEDSEAVYFSDSQELREKLYFWLNPKNDQLRKQIAANARQRCLTEDYSYKPIIRKYLEHFGLDYI